MTKVTARDVYGNTYEATLADITQTIRVYAVIIRDDKLLLTKQWDGYSLPGGGVEIAESLEHALERELKEETGLTITAGKIFYNTDRLFQRDATSKPVQAIMFFILSPQWKVTSQIKPSQKVKRLTQPAPQNGFHWTNLIALPSAIASHLMKY